MARLVNAGVDFATEGERQAAEVLCTLPGDWLVIANKVLPASQGRSYEIDFIVVGKHLVFAIDEKAWRGRIHGTDAIWVMDDGSSQRSPLGKIDYVAKILAGHLTVRAAYFRDIPNHPVVGCVLLSRADTRPIIRDPRAAEGVLLLPTAAAALEKRDAAAAGGTPTVGQLVSQIERALHDLSDRPKFPRQVGPYRITDVTSGPVGSYILQGEHPEGGPRLLRLYNVAAAGAEARDFFLQEFRALQRLRPTGVVPEVFDPFPWSDDFLVVPSARPAGIALGALPPATTEAEAFWEVKRAAAAFRALATIHASGVIHRAIGPDSIFIADGDHGGAPTRDGTCGAPPDPTVMFTSFFAARRGERTIQRQLDALDLNDPYAAPEIRSLGSYEFAGAGSDTYSLALVFLERLSGVPVSRLLAEDGSLALPTPEQGWRYLPQRTVDGLLTLFREALTAGPLADAGDPAARRLTAQEGAQRLEALLTPAGGDIAADVNAERLLDRRYHLVRLLGTGASASTYLATDTEADGLFALKQFLRPASIAQFSQARREFDLLRSHRHPNLPNVYDVYPADNDVHVKLEYIEGIQLSNALDRFTGNVPRCQKLAEELLGAVGHLERHGLLHRDIKPDNVLLRDGSGDAVLIDFGSSTPVGSETAAAGTPGYLPPESYGADRPPPSTDRYAVAAVLFRALVGRMPYVDTGNPFEQQPVSDVPHRPEEERRFARVLLHALAEKPEERYPSAEAFLDALHTAWRDEPVPQPDLQKLTNPWVDQLRSLFRNSTRGNAENRGLDSSFARETYVPTALDERLLPMILERRPLAVFLSGNPGDGKTAFLERVQVALREQAATRVAADESGWVWTHDGHTFRACYDASEAHAGKSADEQLLGRLDGLQGDGPPGANVTVLVAINDGRLAAVLDDHAQEFGWLAEQVHRAYGPARAFDERGVWLIDLKQRAYVAAQPGPASGSVMQRVLATMAAPEHWSFCLGCAAHLACPIFQNAQALGGPNSAEGQPNDAVFAGSSAEPATRLEYLLLMAHLRGQRHITIRDLRSGLAYLLTGDLGCTDIHEQRQRGAALPPAAYWHLAFQTQSDRDVLLGDLASLDPGRYAQPRLERFLYFHRTPADSGALAELATDRLEPAQPGEHAHWVEETKRHLYFSARGDAAPAGAPVIDWRSLLPFRSSGDFAAALSGARPAADLLPMVARGIGRSDALHGAVLDNGLCLRVAHSDENRLTVLKQFPLEEFALTVDRPPADELVETLPATLTLRHRPTKARLELNLDAFEILSRLAAGLEPGGPELQPLLEDLAPFKSAVQLSNTRDLLLVESGRKLHRLTQRDGNVVREPITAETRE